MFGFGCHKSREIIACNQAIIVSLNLGFNEPVWEKYVATDGIQSFPHGREFHALPFFCSSPRNGQRHPIRRPRVIPLGRTRVLFFSSFSFQFHRRAIQRSLTSGASVDISLQNV